MPETVEKRQVCKCHNCGNEAEMVFSCSLEEVPVDPGATDIAEGKTIEPPARVKAKGTCSHCGNEADMWIDL
jgi:hypothetical protein